MAIVITIIIARVSNVIIRGFMVTIVDLFLVLPLKAGSILQGILDPRHLPVSFPEHIKDFLKIRKQNDASIINVCPKLGWFILYPFVQNHET